MSIIDGNEAAAYIAYKLSEVCAIYPITPSSTMAELADQWSCEHKPNLWGTIPLIAEMQSEGGAAGTVHGALQTGSLTTTFTASQGLMLMLPNMYKIAGELTPSVIHVAARALATQGLSIFGDHQDVMAARSTGYAMLASASVQESMDMALVAHVATLESRIPFIHFFDGFRTSHEYNKVEMIDDQVVREMVNFDRVTEHRNRALNPENPVIRGTAQNPDVYFQAREASGIYYQKTPKIVADAMQQLGELTGRHYKPFDYYGAEDADRVIVIMGSGASVVHETVEYLKQTDSSEKVGMLQVRLFRPFSMEHLLEVLPKTVKSIAVLDRTREPGATGEPLFQDVLTCITEAYSDGDLDYLPKIIGGRYGLSSKEFTPAMVRGIFAHLTESKPKKRFTVGIIDDVCHTSIDYDDRFITEDPQSVRAMFYGLGSDGTVGANKNSVKIIGSMDSHHAQAYFVYDSKKSGSQTVSHLRFGNHPIEAPYLIQTASFIACHKDTFLEQGNILRNIESGGSFLLNSQWPADKIWQKLPKIIQQTIVDQKLSFHVIDAYKVAKNSGMGSRINTIMQTCFFALSGVLPRDEAIAEIKKAIEKTYASKGKQVVERNFAAVDQTLAHLDQVEIGQVNLAEADNSEQAQRLAKAPEFVQSVTAKLMAGEGDLIPVSEIPVDGTWPTGTTQWEKRNISREVPGWEPDLCIQCGNCSVVCPHATIRAKYFHKDYLATAPAEFVTAPITARGFPETRYRLQVYVEDCTGCGLCVEACPVQDPKKSGGRAINMVEKQPILETEKANLDHFEFLPQTSRSDVDFSTIRGAQYLEPLFEFSGACSGCGETPYLKLISQLFGDRLMIANATGCSSIYGGNLPTTPWAKNAQGRGPAWANSLFEDNAEFGFGFRLSIDKQMEMASNLLSQLREKLPAELVDGLLGCLQQTEVELAMQRDRLEQLNTLLVDIDDPKARELLDLSDRLIKRVLWIVGGDGWAYDIGSGGLDHVLASGKNVNVLVMDTEVYSNTGGQASKSTPLAAVAKFASGGKRSAKKDMALQAIAYGNVYVARIAMGANPQQSLQAIREAEAYPGPSIILAYSHCIAHGIDMRQGMRQQKLAVECGHWPLFRYNPSLRDQGLNAFRLDSLRPSVPLKEYINGEMRYRLLTRAAPKEAEGLLQEAQNLIQRKWGVYEEMAVHNSLDFVPEKLATVT
ncbi:pyruvate:ferredoxin (flavodoxin) oxidoreductase [Pelagibaculum spongiae]|uniref:Pyruvate-flavodoxin oxidoreductase n=2 Tax=Pelagibaculum spongiae TaxID=2080658 RepID=A0A2V1H5P3_9GAMM|nr:pyruvate:ferredoxin (flavodoxin) oxidoreductase [Pelagibaculum spongiae]